MMYQTEIMRFIRSLRKYDLTKQQVKTLRGQALSGDLAGAKKGLGRMVVKHDNH